MTFVREHWLKTWPEPWDAIADGRKTFEVRRDDRGFRVGDRLRLLLWEPTSCAGGHYLKATGGLTLDREHDAAAIVVEVTYVLPGGRFGIDPGYCVMGIRKVEATP